MKKNQLLKLAMMGLVLLLIGPLNLSCKKGSAPDTKKEAEAASESKEEQKEAKKEAAAEQKEAKKQEEVQKKEESQEDGEKVDSVKGAFQYTGKEMDKGFKKTGSSMKKFFVGDDDKKK